MKKYSLFSVLLFSFFINVSPCAGQQIANRPAHNNGSQTTDPSVLYGHFEIAQVNKEMGITEHINVNYSLSPAPFTDILDFELSTPDPVIFRLDIVNRNGRKLQQWKAAGPNYRHNGQVDILKLEPGKYLVNVYWEKSEELLYSIPFEKSGK